MTRLLRIASWTLLVIIAASAPAGAQRKGTYVDPKKITDNSNKYTDTDLRLLTSKMIESMITSTFAPTDAKGVTPVSDRPVVAMGRLENRTTQDIDVKLILETIEVGILKSRAATFVNRTEQFKKTMAEEEALMQVAGGGSGPARQLMGFQYLLEGSIVEIPSEDKRTRYYKLTLTLTDIKSSAKVWAEEQELKKRK